MSWTCQRCGHDNADDDADSCDHCGGWNANAGSYSDWDCPDCGEENPGAYTTCFKCGTRRPF